MSGWAFLALSLLLVLVAWFYERELAALRKADCCGQCATAWPCRRRRNS